jgi:hypothetical protein
MNRIASAEIGDRAGNAKDAVIAARRHAELRLTAPEELSPGCVEPAVLADLAD